METKLVYVLTSFWHTEYCGADSNVIGVFTSKERAIEQMKKCVMDEIINGSLFEDGEPAPNTVVEDDIENGSWCAYDDGNYLCDSSEFYVREVVLYE